MTILSFSTAPSKNTLMLKHGASYGVKKLKNMNRNPELEKVMEKIFSNT
jgi:hypothetical protein